MDDGVVFGPMSLDSFLLPTNTYAPVCMCVEGCEWETIVVRCKIKWEEDFEIFLCHLCK